MAGFFAEAVDFGLPELAWPLGACPLAKDEPVPTIIDGTR